MTEALVLVAAKSCIARCGAAQWSVTEWIKRAKCVLEIPWNWIIPLFPLFLMSEFLLSLHEYSDLAIHVGVSYSKHVENIEVFCYYVISSSNA